MFCCLITKLLDVDRDILTVYCKSSSGYGVNWFRHSIMVHFDLAVVSVYHGFLRHSLISRALLALMFINCWHPHLISISLS